MRDVFSEDAGTVLLLLVNEILDTKMHLSDVGEEEGATMCTGRPERLVEAGREKLL